MFVSMTSFYSNMLLSKIHERNASRKSTINKADPRYQTLVKNGTIDRLKMTAATMSPEKRYFYEMTGGLDAAIKNFMKDYDKDGDLINPYGVAGMDVTGKGTSWQKLTHVSEEHRQFLFNQVKQDVLKNGGSGFGDYITPTFTKIQLEVPKKDRLAVTWTLEEYEKKYEEAFHMAIRKVNPNWKVGMPFDKDIVRNINRQDVEKMLTVQGKHIVRKSIDISV